MDLNIEIPNTLNSSITATHRTSSNTDLSKPAVDELHSSNYQMFQAPSPQTVIYKECQKNHAVATGGHVVDGCAEFMLAEDGSLMCVACRCHRSFHRPVVHVFGSIAATPINNYIPMHHNNLNPLPYHLQQASDSRFPSQDNPSGVARIVGNGPLHQPRRSKQQRTRFNEQQKKKMFELAQEVGWKIRKLSNEVLDNFCGEVGVERKALKTWMYNNKNTYGKKAIMENVVSGRNGNRADMERDDNAGINGSLGSS